MKQFIDLGEAIINVDNITHVTRGENGQQTQIVVNFINGKSITLESDNAEALIKFLNANSKDVVLGKIPVSYTSLR